MNVIIRHVEYLISRNDCVIIPGLGALLASYQPARIDEAAGRILPPCRVYSFNSGLRHNDGTLTASISRAQSIPYSAAADIVAREVDSMIHQLRADGTLSLGRIGTLSHNALTGTVTFSPFATDILGVTTAWLQPVAVKPAIAVAKDEAESTDRRRSRSTFPRWATIAASISLLLGICFIASTPLTISDAALASFAPTVEQTDIDDIAPVCEPVAEQPRRIDMVKMTRDSLYTDVDTTGRYSYQQTRRMLRELGESFDGSYCIIVSSHPTLDEAQRFLDRYYPDCRILEKDDRYRIYVASFPTVGSAYTALQTYTEKYPSAWVIRR